jgi:outer membrane protein
MWNKPLAMILAFIVGLGGSGAAVYTRITAPKIGYVRMKEAFEKFNMKIELEKQFMKIVVPKQRELDSLSFDLKMTGNRLERMSAPSQQEITDFTIHQNQFLQMRDELEKEKQAKTEEINNQIVIRMQQYVRDYGKENGYSCILGDDGNGYLMYGEDGLDVTAPVINYINTCYAGKK